MKLGRAYTFVFVVTAALTIGACDRSETASEGGGSAAAGQGGSEANPVHSATGTVNSIDRAAGTVNISHEPVESIGWPAMTMNFRLADPDSAAELGPGQRIEFEFTAEGGGTVTAFEPAR